MNDVVVYVVSSSWVNDDSSPTSTPYKRIVGVQRGSDILWATAYNNGDPRYAYDKSKAERATIRLPSTLEDRLISFFMRYFVDISKKTEKYNCHRFAYWMTDNDIVRKLTWPLAPSPAINGHGAIRQLALGHHGVWIFGDGKKCVHSLLAVGIAWQIW